MGDEHAKSTELRALVLEALREVLDPEIGLNVVDLGLVYGVDVEDRAVRVRLTMTTPACPLGGHLVREVETRIRAIDGVGEARVDLVWEPAWSPSLMSPAAKKALGWGS